MDKNHSFIEHAKEYFRRLETDFNFAITKEYADARSAFLLYESATCFVSVATEDMFVYVEMGNPNQPQRTYDVMSVVEFLMPLEKQDTQMLGELDLPYPENVEHQLQRLSDLLFQKAKTILSGNFQQWEQLEQYSKKQADKAEAAIPDMLKKFRGQMYKKWQK